MTATRNHLSITAARTDALFVSALQPSEEPSARYVRRAVAVALRQFGGRGCAERVAQQFGDHPELAVARMRWARQSAAAAFGDRAPWQRGPRRAGQQPAHRAA